jgi:hypothetical protein
MTTFSTFVLLYMTALYLELAERWTYPVFTLVTLLLVALLIWTGITRVTSSRSAWVPPGSHPPGPMALRVTRI